MKLSRKATTAKFFLIGGPYAGQTAYLPSVTMVFSCNGYKGRYIDGEWSDVL